MLTLPARPRSVLAAGDGGTLVLDDRGAAGDRARFAFEPLDGCADYPEAETNVTGEPTRGATAFGEVTGMVDAHMHMMAFEFLGGRVHCGRPWSPYGVATALQDCPDHGPNGIGAVGENTLSYGNPVGTHDTRGWPILKDWPHHASLTHEQTYYKWVERSWRSGLRMFVNLLVDNEVLCTAYPLKKNSCNEMDGVRLQAKRLRELQDYVDAQNGGPGKGWFRIVTDAVRGPPRHQRGQARRRDGHRGLQAVRLRRPGRPAGVHGGADRRAPEGGLRPRRARHGAREQVRQRARAAWPATAARPASSSTAATSVETGRFWQMGPCADAHNHDKEQPTAPSAPDRDQLAGNLAALLPPARRRSTARRRTATRWASRRSACTWSSG